MGWINFIAAGVPILKVRVSWKGPASCMPPMPSFMDKQCTHWVPVVLVASHRLWRTIRTAFVRLTCHILVHYPVWARIRVMTWRDDWNNCKAPAEALCETHASLNGEREGNFSLVPSSCFHSQGLKIELTSNHPNHGDEITQNSSQMILHSVTGLTGNGHHQDSHYISPVSWVCLCSSA